MTQKLKFSMKRYYSKGDETGNGEDSKCEKEESNSMYSMFSDISSWLLFG
jgi:hypothetical protein